MSAFAFLRPFSNELLCLLSGMILFIPYKILLDEGDVRFFGFCTEKLRFSVSLAVAVSGFSIF